MAGFSSRGEAIIPIRFPDSPKFLAFRTGLPACLPAMAIIVVDGFAWRPLQPVRQLSHTNCKIAGKSSSGMVRQRLG